MNYLVQRGKVRSQMIQVPDGLPELLSDITREVLRCQPSAECLLQFVMDYLHSIIVTREKALVVKAIIDRSLKNVDEIIGQLCICDIGRQKAEEMAIVMEECFKNFLRKRRCERGREKEVIRFGDEDILDEMIRRCKFSVEQLQTSQPIIEQAYKRFVTTYMMAAEKSGGTEALYQYFKAREEKRLQDIKLFEAARTIQSNWRGYMTRRTLNIQKRMKICEELKKAWDDRERDRLFNDAARVIQRFFRRIVQIKRYFRKRKEREENVGACGPSDISLSPESYPDRSKKRTPDLEEEEEVIKSPKIEELNMPVPDPEPVEDIAEAPLPKEVEVESPPKVVEEEVAHETAAETAPEDSPEDVPETEAEPAAEAVPETEPAAETEATEAPEEEAPEAEAEAPAAEEPAE